MEAIIYSAALRSHKHPNWEGEGAVEQGIADVARHCAKIDCTSKGEVYFAHFTLLNVMPAIPDVRAVRNVEDIISGVELFLENVSSTFDKCRCLSNSRKASLSHALRQ